MPNRTPVALLFALIVCTPCVAQVSYMGLTPGTNIRTDVEKVLGQPVKQVNEKLVEYAPQSGAQKIYVQYRKGSTVADRVEVLLSAAIPRAQALAAAIGLDVSTMQSQTRVNAKERLEEFFANPHSLVLTYDGKEISSGVIRIGYYGQDLFMSFAPVGGSPPAVVASSALPATPTAFGGFPSTSKTFAEVAEENRRRTQQLNETHQRLVQEAWTAINAGNFPEAVRLSREAIAVNPFHPNGYQVFGAALIEGYQDSAAAETAMRTAIRFGGTAAFRVSHDHSGTFRLYCWGWLYVGANGVSYRSVDGRESFDAAYAGIKEAGINSFVGAGLSAFHLKLVRADGKTDTYNFAPAILRPAPSHLFLRLLPRRGPENRRT